jgi:uncharacterized protein (TIGR01777 family)
MKVVVSGASGFIGEPLVDGLRADGHQVVRLVRRPPKAADEVAYDPRRGELDSTALTGVDAAVNLAGANAGTHRWTPSYKRTIRDSRVGATATLARALASLEPRPRVMVSGSAIGWYGDTGARAVDETAPAADGFMADVVQAWEAATRPAEDAGLRVVHARTGLVVGPGGGMAGRMLPLFRLGVGGRLGSGRQYWSLISLHDELRALRFLLAADEVAGPVNLTGPEPVTNAAATAALARAVHRPAVLPVPGFALRLALGGFSQEVLVSQRILPSRLIAAGFVFDHPDAASIMGAAVGR